LGPGQFSHLSLCTHCRIAADCRLLLLPVLYSTTTSLTAHCLTILGLPATPPLFSPGPTRYTGTCMVEQHIMFLLANGTALPYGMRRNALTRCPPWALRCAERALAERAARACRLQHGTTRLPPHRAPATCRARLRLLLQHAALLEPLRRAAPARFLRDVPAVWVGLTCLFDLPPAGGCCRRNTTHRRRLPPAEVQSP